MIRGLLGVIIFIRKILEEKVSMGDFVSTVIIFGIIALLAVAVLVRNFLKFIKFDEQEEAPRPTLKVSEQPKPQPEKPKEIKTEELKPVAGTPKVPEKVESKKTENTPMPPIKVQGPSEEEGERIARIERIIIKRFENRSGGVVIQGTNGDRNNKENVQSSN